MLRSSTTKILIAAAVCAAAIILYTYNPLSVSFYPRCPSKWLTGFDCPGCGSLRAMHALLHGNISAAWHYNAALFFAIPAIIFFAAAPHFSKNSIAARIYASRYTPIAILIAVIAWWIGRNL